MEEHIIPEEDPNWCYYSDLPSPLSYMTTTQSNSPDNDEKETE